MQLQATDVVEQWRAKKDAKGTHQKCHQEDSTFQEEHAAFATATLDHSTTSQPLPSNATASRLLLGFDASDPRTLRWLTLFRWLQLRASVARRVLPDASALAAYGATSSVSDVLAIRG